MKMHGELTLHIWNPSDRSPGNGEPWRNRGINIDRKPERRMHFQIWRDKQKRRDKIKHRDRNTVHLFIIWKGRGEKGLINTREKMQPQSLKLKKYCDGNVSCVARTQICANEPLTKKMRTYQTTNEKSPWNRVGENQTRLSLHRCFKPVAEWKLSDRKMPHKH